MHNVVDWYYRDLVCRTIEFGFPVTTRNSNVKRCINISRVFNATPLICLRKTAWKNCLREWEWFMSGSNNINDLHESVRHWWKPWANESGIVAFNYSHQFRYASGVDYFGNELHCNQIECFIEGIYKHPNSRRNVITTWNTAEMNDEDCKITNCHGTVIQAFVGSKNDGNSIHLVTYQRSADLICGVPHNWFQYWAFLLWLAHRTGRSVGSLHWIGGDVHLYEQHYALANEIAHASPEPNPPELIYTPTSEDFLADDFTLDREYTPAILTKAEMVI